MNIVSRRRSRSDSESPLVGKTEFRVTWRRQRWTANACDKARRFARLRDAQRFAARLREVDAIYSLALITIEQRAARFGKWTPLKGVVR